jgi:hypothetical protein
LEFPDIAVEFPVFHDPGNFLVAIDNRLYLDWETTTSWDEAHPDDGVGAGERHACLNDAARLENLVGQEWPRGLVVNAKRMIGEGMARAFSGKCNEARGALKQAEVFIAQKSVQVSRYWTLRVGFLCFLVAISGCLFLAIHRDPVCRVLGHTLHLLILAGCLGGIGAFLALILRIGKHQIGSDAGLDLHVAEAGVRIVAGAICGFLMALLIKAGFLLTAFQSSERVPLAILTFALLAGVSTRWVPSMLSKVSAEVSGATTPKSKEAGGAP